MPVIFILAAFGLIAYNAKDVPRTSTKEIYVNSSKQKVRIIRETTPGETK